MPDRTLGIVIDGATGRLGTTQHLRALLAIRGEGGLPLTNGDRLMPEPVLLGRNPEKLAALAEKSGGLTWSTDRDASLADLPVVGEIRGLGMMAGIELVTDKGTKAPALGLAPKIGREAIARGLLVRPRAGSADPAFGDTICLSPPLSTPTEILDRIPQILREAVTAAIK